MKERKEKATTGQVTNQQIKATTFTPPTTVLTLGARPLVDAYSDDDEDEDEDDESKKSKGGVSIAPPPSLMESSNTTTSFNNVPPPSQTPDTSAPKMNVNMNVSGVAAKIMAKMGYKEGKLLSISNFLIRTLKNCCPYNDSD